MFPFLTSRYFGLDAFGRLFGVIAALVGIATGLGHSGDALLMSGVPVALVCIVPIVTLGPAPAHKHSAVEGHDDAAACS